MLGDWKCACTSRTFVDSALAGSQADASFFSAPMSFPDSGKATTTTTSHKPTTSHLVQLPAGISAILLNLLTDSPRLPPAAACLARSLLRNHALPTGRKGPASHARQRRVGGQAAAHIEGGCPLTGVSR